MDSAILLINTYFTYHELRKLYSLRLIYLKNTWSFVDGTVCAIIYATSATNLAFRTVIFNYKSATRAMHSITIILIYLRLLTFIRSFKKLAFMVRMIMQSIIDMRYFMIILSTLVASFSLTGF